MDNSIFPNGHDEFVAEWFVELRPTADDYDIHGNIVRHLAERLSVGNAAVVVDHPAPLVSAFHKRWQRLIKEVERALAYTREPARRTQLQERLDILRRVRFGLECGGSSPFVMLVDAVAPPVLPPGCYTLYVAAPMDSAHLTSLMRKLPHHGALIIYG